MMLAERDQDPIYVKTAAREVFDVTGAGDTVIAVLTLGLTGGVPLIAAASLANVAAGMVVQRLGVATVPSQELVKAVAGPTRAVTVDAC